MYEIKIYTKKFYCHKFETIIAGDQYNLRKLRRVSSFTWPSMEGDRNVYALFAV